MSPLELHCQISTRPEAPALWGPIPGAGADQGDVEEAGEGRAPEGRLLHPAFLSTETHNQRTHSLSRHFTLNAKMFMLC